MTELPLDQILQGDCLEILKNLPANAVDMIFADPPYNLQLKGDLWRPNLTKVDGVVEEWDRFSSFKDYDAFTRVWLTECRRVLRRSGTIWVIGTYHNIYRVGTILQDLGFWTLNDVVWIKHNPMPNFRGVRFTNAHETLIWAQKERGARYTFHHYDMKALNDDLQMRSDWYLPICNGKERIRNNGSKVHATQKPESLLYRIILSSTNPGDVILDPFFGTGTTGAVARLLNRHWIGIELDQEYIRVAKQRIEAIQPLEKMEFVFDTHAKTPAHRVTFGALLESGLLRPGQDLYLELGKRNGEIGEISATILANGHLYYQGITGSIHQIGRAILNAPCNGWMVWYYLDESSGNRIVIDQLRQKVKAEYARHGGE